MIHVLWRGVLVWIFALARSYNDATLRDTLSPKQKRVTGRLSRRKGSLGRLRLSRVDLAHSNHRHGRVYDELVPVLPTQPRLSVSGGVKAGLWGYAWKALAVPGVPVSASGRRMSRAGGEAERGGWDITSGPEPMPCMSGTSAASTSASSV
jgi:hypothetical protein